MATPYWGKLPPPNVARANSLRQLESNIRKGKDSLVIDTNMDQERPSRRTSTLPQSRPNRNSTQTDRTEAPTISTQSPFASPLASEFRGGGLAPRPPSFTQGVPEPAYNKEFLEKRNRRATRNREQEEYEDSLVLPAAPDVPRAPPLSYKEPHGSSASSQQPVRSRSRRRSEGPVSPRKNAVEDNYRADRQGERKPIDKDTYQPSRADANGKAAVRRGASQRQRPERSNTLISEGETQKRREWAADKSPLQRLELTLDSITKEEKRARVEAAERRALESKTGSTAEKSNQSSVRFRNRPVAKAAPETGSQSQPRDVEAGVERNSTVRQKDRLQHGGTTEESQPADTENWTSFRSDRGIDHGIRHEVSTSSNADQSTRDRSHAPVTAAAAAVAGAAISNRSSGSNKPKKNPPDDPWLQTRAQAEQQYSEVIPRRFSNARQQGVASSPEDNAGPSRDVAFESHSRSSSDKELPLPLLPPEARGSRRSSDEEDFDSVEDTNNRSFRRGTIRKVQQLTGETSPPQRRAGTGVQTERVMVNGTHYEMPPATAQKVHHHLNLLHSHKDSDGQGVYVPSRRIDEWKKGGVALLSGPLLDLEVSDDASDADKDRAWWEAGNTGQRRKSSVRQRKAEAYDGEYDVSNAPTRFKPQLFLKSGPMLRYCGLRREKVKTRSNRGPPGVTTDREIWRGSIMIVTQDLHSSYELAPTLRLFLQPAELLPPPPAQVDGEELAPEYVDPLAGLPKIGRDGRTLYVRPVDHLEEAVDLSREESDEGLYEMQRSPLDGAAGKKPACQKSHYDGEKAGKYKEVRGFRLHAEQGVTFWRFNIEIELRDKQQRVAYRINRGPATAFWVPASGGAMNIMFYSCNGFSHDIDPNLFCGPDPLWRDVLSTHQTQPFHVMLGGGDQVYNDRVMDDCELYQAWTQIRDPHHKEHAPFTPELQDELEAFYLNRYCMWFSQGLFALAASQIPMINIFDDHDIIDGFGSYPDDYMKSAVFSGLGSVAFKYYMLFQHQSSIDEGEESEPSWILGTQPGPYIKELSRSVFTHLGRDIAFLGLDCRTERMYDEIISAETYHKVFDRMEKEIIKGETKHLIVLLGIPVAYPRMVWLENILTSRAMEPVKAMSRAGLLGKKLLNRMDGGVEILDDLDDHWTAKHHKEERNWLIQEFQDLAAEKSVRVTILGGDVHLAAIGQFYSNPKLSIPKDRDFRYMPNVISSAIVNAPPPDTLADLLNKRNKVHHLDDVTDEDMIPIFTHDVNGKPRNNKRLLNRRNWCSIKVYDPELTPPATPQTDRSPSPPPKRGLLRRFSSSKGPSYRPDGAAPPLSNPKFFGRRDSTSIPPLTKAGGFFSRRGSLSSRRPSMDSQSSQRPGMLTRTLSLTRNDFIPKRSFSLFNRKKKRPDDGGINGAWGEEDTETDNYDDDDDDDDDDERLDQTRNYGEVGRNQQNQGHLQRSQTQHQPQRLGIRGGSGGHESPDGYFPQIPLQTARQPQHPAESASTSMAGGQKQRVFQPQTQPRPQHQPQYTAPGALGRAQFKRTPTGLSQKQLSKGGHEVDLEGGLDICLNLEVNSKDPTGITTPYRLLVPALFYEEGDDEPVAPPVSNSQQQKIGGLKRFASLRRGSDAGHNDGGPAGGYGNGKGREERGNYIF